VAGIYNVSILLLSYSLFIASTAQYMYSIVVLISGEEVQHQLAASRVGQEVPDLESILPSPTLLPYLHPQDLLLGLSAGVVLEHVVPRVSCTGTTSTWQ
jgi:hypothetical protein